MYGCGLLAAWLVLVFYFVFLICLYQRSERKNVAKVNDSISSMSTLQM